MQRSHIETRELGLPLSAFAEQHGYPVQEWEAVAEGLGVDKLSDLGVLDEDDMVCSVDHVPGPSVCA